MRHDYADIITRTNCDKTVVLDGEIVGGCQVARAGNPGVVVVYLFKHPDDQTHDLYIFSGNVEIMDTEDARREYPDLKRFDGRQHINDGFGPLRGELLPDKF